jgi:hypothetical protein
MRRISKRTLGAATAAAVAALLGLAASRPGPVPGRGGDARGARAPAETGPSPAEVGGDGHDAAADVGNDGHDAAADVGDDGHDAAAADVDVDVDDAAGRAREAGAAPPPRAAGGGPAPEPRARIVRAIRASYAREVDRRDAMVRELEASGPSREPWTRGAGVAFGRWLREAAPEGLAAPRAGDLRCFAAGCAAALAFADREAADAFAARARATPFDWGGGRAITPPEGLASGEVLVTWMLLRPDDL